MAMPQRDNAIEEIKRLEPPSHIRFGVPSTLLEFAVNPLPMRRQLRLRHSRIVTPKRRLNSFFR